MSPFPWLRRGSAAVVLCCVAALLSGCKKDEVGSVVPVKGKVTVDGQPVTSGQVSYLPTSGDAKGGNSSGQISSSGEYTIFTAGKEGVPPGKYKITVTPSMVPQPGATKMPTSPFSSKYSDVKTTPLEMEVPSSKGYDLELKK